MSEESRELNKRFSELIANFINENSLSCESCQKYVRGKCKSKVYCAVKDRQIIAFERKEFGNDR